MYLLRECLIFAGRRSRVAGRGWRVAGKLSMVNFRGSRVHCYERKMSPVQENVGFPVLGLPMFKYRDTRNLLFESSDVALLARCGRCTFIKVFFSVIIMLSCHEARSDLLWYDEL